MLKIGPKSNTDKVEAFPGTYSSFVVGQRKLGSYEYLPISMRSDVTKLEVDEVERLFTRMWSKSPVNLKDEAKIDTSQHLFTTGGTYFAPLDGDYVIGDDVTNMVTYLVTYSNETTETYSAGSYMRTVTNPLGIAIEEVKEGDRPLHKRANTVVSVEQLGSVSDDRGISYTRMSYDWDYNHGEERGYKSGEEGYSISLKFRVYQEDSDRGYVFFDDSRLETSNVLWEFSPDSGAHWYCYFAMPNKPYTRVSLPYKTNQIRVRAQSSSDEEWIRGYSIQPHTSYRLYPAPEETPVVEKVTPMRWETSTPVNSPIFEVTTEDGEKVRTRRYMLPQGTDTLLPDKPDLSMTYYDATPLTPNEN